METEDASALRSIPSALLRVLCGRGSPGSPRRTQSYAEAGRKGLISLYAFGAPPGCKALPRCARPTTKTGEIHRPPRRVNCDAELRGGENKRGNTDASALRPIPSALLRFLCGRGSPYSPRRTQSYAEASKKGFGVGSFLSPPLASPGVSSDVLIPSHLLSVR